LLDNIAIYVSPRGGMDDMFFTAGVTADEKNSGTVDLKDALPPMWEGKYQGHFFAFDHSFGLGTEAVQEGVTHLALLEGPMGGFGSFYFNGDEIAHNGLILYFSERDNTYRYLHCRQCAVEVLKWMTEQQQAWSENPRPASLVA
jgi:hypothetical protein